MDAKITDSTGTNSKGDAMFDLANETACSLGAHDSEFWDSEVAAANANTHFCQSLNSRFGGSYTRLEACKIKSFEQSSGIDMTIADC